MRLRHFTTHTLPVVDVWEVEMEAEWVTCPWNASIAAQGYGTLAQCLTWLEASVFASECLAWCVGPCQGR